jgi:hypothetical protein
MAHTSGIETDGAVIGPRPAVVALPGRSCGHVLGTVARHGGEEPGGCA